MKRYRLTGYAERRAMATMAAHGLTPRQREVMWLYIHGMTHAEIADRLSINKATVHKRLECARARCDVPGWARPTNIRVRLLRSLVGAA